MLNCMPSRDFTGKYPNKKSPAICSFLHRMWHAPGVHIASPHPPSAPQQHSPGMMKKLSNPLTSSLDITPVLRLTPASGHLTQSPCSKLTSSGLKLTEAVWSTVWCVREFHLRALQQGNESQSLRWERDLSCYLNIEPICVLHIPFSLSRHLQ